MLFELSDVEYQYEDGTSALESLSFAIESGDSVAILGANGSGKSTLLRILDGLYFATRGSLAFRGKKLDERALQNAEFRQDFRQSVAFVFQNADAQLFNPTVVDEVAFGPRQQGLMESEVAKRVGETLEFLGISHLAERAPFRLSGGEKRKVAIASVLAMNPQVLLFDEPFLGLDPRGQTWLVRTLNQLHGAGKTTIIATHTLDLVPRVAKTALVLSEDHRLVKIGPVSQVVNDNPLLISANLIEEQLVNL